jgi:hypothetical protein
MTTSKGRAGLTALLAILALLLISPSLAAGAAPKVACFQLPGTTPDLGCRTLASSTLKVLWQSSDCTTLWVCDLHTGAIAALPLPTGVGASYWDIDANTAAYACDAASLQRRVYLYDVGTNQAYPDAVPLPSGLGSDGWQDCPVLTDGKVLFFASTAAGDSQAFYLSTFDAAMHTIGTPFAGPDYTHDIGWPPEISGDTVAWSASGHIVASVMNESTDPPTSASVVVDPSPDPSYQGDNPRLPAVSGNLVVYWRTSFGNTITGSLIDPITHTAGSLTTLATLVTTGGNPRISGNLMVWPEGTSIDGAFVDATGATPTASAPFTITSSGTQPDVAGNLVTWYDKVTGKRWGALINPTLPTTAAPSAASVRHGKAVTLKYKVADQLWKTNVQIQIRNAHNKVVLTLKKGWQATNKALSARFVCRLAKGKYRFFVKATDVGGLAVKKPAVNRLVVR